MMNYTTNLSSHFSVFNKYSEHNRYDVELEYTGEV